MLITFSLSVSLSLFFCLSPLSVSLCVSPSLPPSLPLSTLDTASPDEGDSESVCSSLDGSVLSEDWGGGGSGSGKGEEVGTEVEEDLQFVLSEQVDQLSDKR